MHLGAVFAVEHNDADAAHPGRILLAGGNEAASPSKVASPVKNGERGANGPIGVGAPRAKPDFSKLPKPPSALLAKLNAFMPKMQAANDTLKEAMKTRPAEDFDIEHVEDDDDASDSDSASDSDTEHMDAEANPDAYKVNAAIRSIEAQQRKDARAAAKAPSIVMPSLSSFGKLHVGLVQWSPVGLRARRFTQGSSMAQLILCDAPSMSSSLHASAQ